MSHSVTEEEVFDWLKTDREENFACSVGKGSDKSFNIVTNLYLKSYKFKVYDHGEVIYCGLNIDEAVKKYNSAI